MEKEIRVGETRRIKQMWSESEKVTRSGQGQQLRPKYEQKEKENDGQACDFSLNPNGMKKVFWVTSRQIKEIKNQK